MIKGWGNVLIKKQIKREKNRRQNLIMFSIILMAGISYLVIVLNDQRIFKYWETYASYGFVALIDMLLIINTIKILIDGYYDFSIINQRVKIKDSIIRKPMVIQAEKISYVEVTEKPREDFEILVVIEKGKRSKSFLNFDGEFIEKHSCYKELHQDIITNNPEKDYYAYLIKKGGARKYYYLYLLFKNSYNSKFSENSIILIKRFIEEYNLA